MVRTRYFAQFFSHLALISILFGLLSCKSDVEDKTNLSTESVINVDSLTITNTLPIRADKSENSMIIKKIYSLSACLSENNLGQKLDRRIVEASGAPLMSNKTDPSGCIYWEHTFNMDYTTGRERCQILNLKITIPSSNIQKTIRYSVDTSTDQVADLDRGKGCSVIENDSSIKDINQSGGPLILEKIELYWAGQEDERRSDVRTLTYRTNIKSCIKARLTDTRLTNTKISIQISDRSNLHEPIVLDDIPTNESGCFDRLFSSPYEQFSYSHWLEKDITITVVEGPLKGKSVGTMIYLNPYEIARTFFGIDSRWDKPMVNIKPQNNRIHIDGVMYIQIGNDIENFSVDKYLNLTVSKSYQIVLNPRIDLGHRFTKDYDRYVKMHDGRFRLKFMILAPDKADIELDETNFKEFTYITGAERIVEVKDGIINSLISIPVKHNDLPRLAKRAVSVFKLEPIVETGLIESTVTGFFKAKIPWIKTNVLQSETLQSTEEQLSYQMNAEQSKEDIQSVSEQIGSNIDVILKENLVEPSKSSSDLNEQEGFVTDETKLRYKRCIEYLFTKTSTGVDQTGTDNCRFDEGSNVVKELSSNPYALTQSSKDIFVNKELLHKYPNLITSNTIPSERPSFVDSYRKRGMRSRSKEEEQEQEQEIDLDDSQILTQSEQDKTQGPKERNFQIPEGLIAKVYDTISVNEGKSRGEKEELLENKAFRAVMITLCRDAFPKPKQGEGLLSRYFGKSENPEFKKCLNNSNRYFEHSIYMHTNNVNKTSPRYSTGFSLGIGARFSSSYVTNNSTYLSKRVGADIGFKLPLGEFFGSGVKLFDMSYTRSQGDSDNQNWSDDISTSRNLSVEKFIIDVKGDFQKCLLVTGKDYISAEAQKMISMAGGPGGPPILLPRQHNQYNTKLDKQYYLCDQSQELTVSEPWYYIQAEVNSAPMLTDNMGPTERKLIKVLRGDTTFSQLKKIFEDKTKVYLLESQSNMETPDQKLYENWGHLLENEPPPATANKWLIKNFQGAFPGTIQ